jgi:hypothetical protein
VPGLAKPGPPLKSTRNLTARRRPGGKAGTPLPERRITAAARLLKCTSGLAFGRSESLVRAAMKKWTNRQKLAGGVFLVAAAAFGVDRMTATDSSSDAVAPSPAAGPVAGANPPPGRPAGGATPARPVAGGAAVAAAATALLAQRLDRVAAAEGLEPGRTADGFRPPDGWFAPRAAADARPIVNDRVAQFKARHKLTAVMRGGAKGGTGVAVLSGAGGGTAVRVGQAIDGFVLTAVRDAAVVLVAGDDQVELVLDRPTLSSTAQ